VIEGNDRQGARWGLGLRGGHGQRVGQEQESNGGESASRTLSGGAGQHEMGWIGYCSKSSCDYWVSRLGRDPGPSCSTLLLSLCPWSKPQRASEASEAIE
jgi:hypothetical protein